MQVLSNSPHCKGNCEIKELESFVNLCKEQHEGFDKISGQPSEAVLYHYTSFDGLKGIIESRCLWLTHFRYLNDTSEIVYARDEVLKKIEEILRNQLTDLEEHLQWQMFRQTFKNMIETNMNFYIFSFCVKPNYLPAWRWYAANGCGVAIGFRKELFIQKSADHTNDSKRMVSFHKVYYEIANKAVKNLIENLIKITRSEFQKAKQNKYYNHSPMCFLKGIHPILAAYLIPILVCLKHGAYQEEHEYRLCESEFSEERQNKLCKIDIPFDKRHWRDSMQTTQPFVKTIPITISEQFDCEDICKIWVGPRCNFEHAKHQIIELLSQNKYTNLKQIKIEKSDIPYNPR